MFTTTRSGSFLKQFGGPGDNDIVCFKFWQAVIASGCPGECAYCFLQTQYPYRTGRYQLKGTLFSNLEDIVPQMRGWLKRQTEPTGMILGENQDGLAFESPYKRLLGKTPLEMLVPLFADENPNGHTLVILSKFVSTQYAEALGPSPNVVFSWSLSLPSISKQYEEKVSPLEFRLRKAEELKAAGYRVRFRLDALAPVPTWREDVHEIMERINAIGPEMLTLGALRASNPASLRQAAEANGRDASIFRYISTVDPSGFKHRTEHEFHTEAFQLVRELVDPAIAFGLCKEDASMWRAAGVPWNGCHCLHGKKDAVSYTRIAGLRRKLIQRPIVESVACAD